MAMRKPIGMTATLRLLPIACGIMLMPAPLLAQSPSADSNPPIVASSAVTLSGGQKINSFDIGFVDPVINRYVLADRTNKAIDIVDTTTNKVVSQFQPGFVGFTGNNDTSGPDGVLIVDHKEVWA